MQKYVACKWTGKRHANAHVKGICTVKFDANRKARITIDFSGFVLRW